MEFIDAKTIVTNGRPDSNYLQAEYVMNIYRGCDHGCIYCYARSCYYEKTNNFEIIRAKKNALQIIRDDLCRKVKPGVVITGSVSDPYNKLEEEHKLTRNALELINAFDFGICIVTKSSLVTRDVDVLEDIKTHSPASVNFSITCTDDETCQKVEPHVSLTSERFKAIEKLAKNNLIVGVLIDPVIPYITDTLDNVRELVKKAKYHGAKYVHISTLVTMADIQRDYFYQEAEKHYPGITEKYRQRYKSYYRCWSDRSKKLWDVFAQTCEAEGLIYNMRLANRLIRQGYDDLASFDVLGKHR